MSVSKFGENSVLQLTTLSKPDFRQGKIYSQLTLKEGQLVVSSKSLVVSDYGKTQEEQLEQLEEIAAKIEQLILGEICEIPWESKQAQEVNLFYIKSNLEEVEQYLLEKVDKTQDVPLTIWGKATANLSKFFSLGRKEDLHTNALELETLNSKETVKKNISKKIRDSIAAVEILSQPIDQMAFDKTLEKKESFLDSTNDILEHFSFSEPKVWKEFQKEYKKIYDKFSEHPKVENLIVANRLYGLIYTCYQMGYDSLLELCKHSQKDILRLYNAWNLGFDYQEELKKAIENRDLLTIERHLIGMCGSPWEKGIETSTLSIQLKGLYHLIALIKSKEEASAPTLIEKGTQVLEKGIELGGYLIERIASTISQTSTLFFEKVWMFSLPGI